MAENSSSNSSGVCSVFDTHPYVIVAAVSSGSAIVSALCCIFVTGLVFLLKKHYFFIQRLVLYHCLAALLRSFSTILRLHRLGYNSEGEALDVVCTISGFTGQLTLWILIMDYSVITFTLLMTVVFHKNVARLEGLFVVLIFIFPLTFNWIPFINNTYGRAGLWCWIRTVNYDDCSKHRFGVILRDVLWNVPFLIVLLVMIPMFLITIIYVARQRCCKRGKDTHNPEMERMRKHLNEQVFPLLFFPFGVIFLNLFPTINVIYGYINANNPSYAIWMLHAICSPLQGGYIALVYVLDRDTLRQLTYSKIKATLVGRDTVCRYPMEAGGISDSAFIGDHPSATHYRQYRDASFFKSQRTN